MDLTRRQFGGVVGGAALVVWGGAGAELGTIQVPAKVDKAHIRYLRATVDQLYERDQMVGGAALARGALRQFYRAQRMLGESDYGERTGQQLMTAAGELAVCVGWLAYDAGEHDLAHHLYTEAMTLADEADDGTLAIQVRGKNGAPGRAAGPQQDTWHRAASAAADRPGCRNGAAGPRTAGARAARGPRSHRPRRPRR